MICIALYWLVSIWVERTLVLNGWAFSSLNYIWDKVIKNGLSKFFKGCLLQNLLSPLLNTFFHLCTQDAVYKFPSKMTKCRLGCLYQLSLNFPKKMFWHLQKVTKEKGSWIHFQSSCTLTTVTLLLMGSVASISL